MTDPSHRPHGPVLMSAENPNGWALEDLLPVLRAELFAKCVKINGDARPVARDVLANNVQIIALITQAEALQRDSLARLALVGPNAGPLGRPRIGSGSAGGPAPDSSSS